MKLEFNTADLTARETQGLLVLFEILAGDTFERSSAPTVSIRETATPHVNAREKTVGLIPPPPYSVNEVAEFVKGVDALPAEAIAGAIPEPVEKPKRTRRTKAEMEAAQEPVDPTPAISPVTLEKPTSDSSTQPSLAASSSTEAPTLEVLRNALQAYQNKKGMPAAIELLKDFECSRISQIQALRVDLQHEFLKLASNA